MAAQEGRWWRQFQRRQASSAHWSMVLFQSGGPATASSSLAVSSRPVVRAAAGALAPLASSTPLHMRTPPTPLPRCPLRHPPRTRRVWLLRSTRWLCRTAAGSLTRVHLATCRLRMVYFSPAYHPLTPPLQSVTVIPFPSHDVATPPSPPPLLVSSLKMSLSFLL